jgi:hypothetical protein
MAPMLMNEQPSEKPVREILQQLRVHSEFPAPPRGVADPKLIDRITFVAAVISVVLCAGALLAMIWEGVDVIDGMKFIGSIMVLLAALLIFRAINSQFGE